MSQPNAHPDIPNGIEPSSLPRSPRALTPKIKSAVMAEPKVRFWWLLVGLMTLATIGFTIKGLIQWQQDADVIGSGAVVKAVGYMPGGSRIRGRPLSVGQGSSVEIEYEYEGKKIKSLGPLFQTGEEYIAGVPFDIHIDRSDPSVWTNRKTAVPFWENLIGAFVGIIATFGCVLAALFVGLRYKQLWIAGEPRPARVVEHRHTAMAPRSVQLVCAVRQMKEERLVSVFMPQSAAVPEVGQHIDLIVNDSVSMALVASKFWA